MKLRPRGAKLAVGLLLVSGVLELCASDNDTWSMTQDMRARIINKLRKDYRKLKKQEGALKLIGGESGDYEGTANIFSNIGNLSFSIVQIYLARKHIRRYSEKSKRAKE